MRACAAFITLSLQDVVSAKKYMLTLLFAHRAVGPYPSDTYMARPLLPGHRKVYRAFYVGGGFFFQLLGDSRYRHPTR